MAKSNNYGLPISLVLHVIIFAIPVSMAVSKHFNEVELFVIDERIIQPVKEKIVKPKPKEMPKVLQTHYEVIKQEVVKEFQPETVVTEPEIKESPLPEIVEPVIVSNRPDAAPMSPAPKPKALPQPLPVPETPKILHDVEFGSASGPRFMHREMPVYPLMARRLGKEGRVLLRLTIDEKGNLLNIEVLEGAGYGFTEAAVEAVKKSTFTPAKMDGKAVMSKALLPVKFRLRRD